MITDQTGHKLLLILALKVVVLCCGEAASPLTIFVCLRVVQIKYFNRSQTTHPSSGENSCSCFNVCQKQAVNNRCINGYQQIYVGRPVSTKHGLRTTDYGLGIKHGLGYYIHFQCYERATYTCIRHAMQPGLCEK